MIRRNYPLIKIIIAIFIAIAITCSPSKAAIDFDGVDDYIEIVDSASIKPTSISISFWFYRDSVVGNWDIAFIKTTGNGWADGYGFTSTHPTGNPMRFWVNNYGIGFPSITIPTGAWYHIVGTYDLANVNLYLDGVSQGSFAYSTPISYAATPSLYLGKQGAGHGYRIDGKLDDVRIYNRALSSAEVETLYKSRKKRIGGSLAQGLVAHFEMDDSEIGSAVGTIIDASGNSNHGTGNGGASLKFIEGVVQR